MRRGPSATPAGPETPDGWHQALALLDEVGEMDSTDLSRAELVDLIESVSD
jgi:hypothetical protein